MSPELKEFYAELLEWIETGFQHHPTFHKDCGLCSQLEYWAVRRLGSRFDELWDEQQEMFKSAGLHHDYPFDTKESYQYAYINDSMYENPKRLAWIKEHAS